MKLTVIGIVLMLAVLGALYVFTSKPATPEGETPVVTTPQDHPPATNFNL
jgi:flagellar basal body-associated protein FliL